MHRADLLSPSCFALTNVFAGSARCPRSILSSVRATVHSQRQECRSRHRTGNGWGSEGSPQPLSTGGLWGNEVLSPSMSPPQLAEMEMQQGNLASPDCSRVPQHLQGVSAEGRGWALRRLPQATLLENTPREAPGLLFSSSALSKKSRDIRERCPVPGHEEGQSPEGIDLVALCNVAEEIKISPKISYTIK